METGQTSSVRGVGQLIVEVDSARGRKCCLLIKRTGEVKGKDAHADRL